MRIINIIPPIAMHNRQMWNDLMHYNQEKTRAALENLKQTAAVLEHCCNDELQWYKKAKKYGISTQDNHNTYNTIFQIIQQIMEINIRKHSRPDNLAVHRTTHITENYTAPRTIEDMYGSSDDLLDFISHLKSAGDMPINTAADTIAADTIAADTIATTLKDKIDNMTDSEIADTLAKIPDPQDEVDRVMNARRFQAMVIEDAPQSKHPVRFITDVDGKSSNVAEPPPANILASLKKEEYDNLMVHIYNAAKDMVEKMVDKSKLNAEQIEQMIFKHADKMLAAYIEKNKRPPGL